MGELTGFGWICVTVGIISLIFGVAFALLKNFPFAGVAFAIAGLCGLGLLVDYWLL